MSLLLNLRSCVRTFQPNLTKLACSAKILSKFAKILPRKRLVSKRVVPSFNWEANSNHFKHHFYLNYLHHRDHNLHPIALQLILSPRHHLRTWLWNHRASSTQISSRYDLNVSCLSPSLCYRWGQFQSLSPFGFSALFLQVPLPSACVFYDDFLKDLPFL